ncbi:hypothetical protein KC887_08765 [Candidatus Kaiserbacteria bacterium]|nr:hypothetical protein [Candidatus Kaiserbacteria bacterium]
MTVLRLSNSTTILEINEANGTAAIISAGPVGPSGLIPPGGTDGQVLGKQGVSTTWLSVGTSEEIDTKIAEHNQAEVAHTQISSGRDFSALFLNGLV